MTHLGVRLVADFLDDPTYGVNAILAATGGSALPLYPGDAAPPPIAIYDETRAGWAARNQVPRPQSVSPAIAFPALVVFASDGRLSGSITAAQDTGMRSTDGTIRIGIQVLIRNSDTARGMTQAMYYFRAIRGALLWFVEPAQQAAREICGTRLSPPKDDVQYGQLDSPVADVVSAGVLLYPFPFIETTPVTEE